MRYFLRRLTAIGVAMLIGINLTACSSGNTGNSNNPEQVAAIQTIANQYFESYSVTHGFSAIGITAQCNGFNNSQPVTVFVGTMGYPNIDPRPIQNNSIWQIGSISKSFASVVLLQLASDSHYNFSLDDPLTKWLPEYRYYTWPNGNIVPTIRQIMNI